MEGVAENSSLFLVACYTSNESVLSSRNIRKYAASEDLPAVVMRSYVRSEILTAVTMKNAVFWDVALCGSCKNRRFGET
jgi:hypothetical protein